MNKKRVDGWLIKAKEALETVGIAKEGKVNNSFRGQISAFGAAVIMGSFKSAVAFFIKQGAASVERQKLIQAMYYVISERVESPESILNIVCLESGNELEKQFIDASIAIKLALNFFEREN